MSRTITAYVPPDFLKNSSVDDIYNNMKETAPADMDTGEASFFWDHTRPVAIEKAEMVQFKLNETVKLIFPQWAYDIYLDLHAEMKGLTRKAATLSTGQVTVTGTPGTQIPDGAQFATPAVGSTSSIIFIAVGTTTIGAGGTATINVKALNAGTNGNVAANTIKLMVKPIDGITSITNTQPTTGGTDVESDEDLRQRILEAAQVVPLSGSDTDYIKWAKEVAGVGQAFVLAEWNGPGTVKIIIVDSNGQPANAALITAVQNYIAPDDGTGFAPIGAIITVAAPTPKIMDYAFTLVLKAGADKETTISAIKEAFQSYYAEVGVGGIVKYNTIAAKIQGTSGVDDFSGLTINGGTANIQMGGAEYPVTGTVTVP